MSVTYMLDTNTASYIVKGLSPRARKKLIECSQTDEVCISSITEAEIRYGMAKRGLSTQKQSAIEQFLLAIDILPWDTAAAKEYGTARASLEAAGKPLANMDLLIAAHAASIRAVLVTSDGNFKNRSRYFSALATENWADDV